MIPEQGWNYRPATRGVSHVAMVAIPDGLGYYSHSHLPMVRVKTIRSQMTIATSPEVPLGRWLWRFGTSSREVAMVVWDLLQGGGYGGLGPDGLPFF